MVKALDSYPASTPEELSFSTGDVLTVTKKDPSGWWEAEFNGKMGLIPSNFVEDHTAANPEPPSPSPPDQISTKDQPKKPFGGFGGAPQQQDGFGGTQQQGEVFPENLPQGGGFAQISTKGSFLLYLFPSFVLASSPILVFISPDPGFTDRLSDIQLNQATNPICGLKATKDCGLEEAVKIFQKNSELKEMTMGGFLVLANMAAGNLSSNPHNLSQDEIAAIHLYTQETPLYRVLNDRLRSEKRELLVPFFPYLKLLLRAFFKLPVIKCPVYRGVPKDLSKNFVSGKSYIWWGLTSTATDLEVRFRFSRFHQAQHSYYFSALENRS